MDGQNGPAMSTGSPPRSRRRLALTFLGVLLVTGGISGATYLRYANEHLHAAPDAPRCIRTARRALRKPVIASGTEPWETSKGEVHVSEQEYRALTCVSTFDKELAKRIAEVFSEVDPVPRAAALAALVRNAPQGPAGDREADALYQLVDGALAALPQTLPEVKAASEEIDRIQGCRFDTKLPCPTRPPMPVLVWIGAVPAAGAALGLLGLGAVNAFEALREALRARRKRKNKQRKKQREAPVQAEEKAAPTPPPPP